MKLQRVILSSDNNKKFLRLCKYVSLAWKNLINVTPTLYYIGDTITEEIKNFEGEVCIFKPMKNIPTHYQAQCIRLLAPCLYKNEISITSDMDIIPLSFDYFQGSIEQFPEDKFVIYRPFDKIPEGKNYKYHTYEIPICYNAALGNTWRDIFNIKNIDDIKTTLEKWWNIEKMWTTDQRMLHKYIDVWSHENQKCIYLGDKLTKFKRFDSPKKLSILYYCFWGKLSKFSDIHLSIEDCKLNEVLNIMFKKLKIIK